MTFEFFLAYRDENGSVHGFHGISLENLAKAKGSAILKAKAKLRTSVFSENRIIKSVGQLTPAEQLQVQNDWTKGIKKAA